MRLAAGITVNLDLHAHFLVANHVAPTANEAACPTDSSFLALLVVFFRASPGSRELLSI